MSDLPLHIQVLVHLRNQVRQRRDQHRAKVGDGLEDREYQRHVGRIKEATALLEEIEELMKGSLEEIEDAEEAANERRNSRNRTSRKTSRPTQ